MRFEGPDPENVNAHWSAFLTNTNQKAIAEHLRITLAGGYVWAAYNEGFPGLGVRVSRRDLVPAKGEPTGVVWGDLDNGTAHITVCDTYGVWGLSSRLTEQPPWGEIEDPDLLERVKWSSRISWDRSDGQSDTYRIAHRVPAGQLTHWAVLPLGEVAS